MKCYTTKPELSRIAAIQEDDGDDMFDFGSGVSGFRSTESTFEKVSVSYDRDTGEFVGIGKFLDFAEGKGAYGAKPEEESKGAASNTTTDTATMLLSQSRDMTETAFESANRRWQESMTPSFVVLQA